MKKQHSITIGIDEVGRGPVAGPVAVAALCYEKKHIKAFEELTEGIKDSKKLSEKKRKEWFTKLREGKEKEIINYAVSFVPASAIDKGGISGGIRAALERSLKQLGCDPTLSYVLLDGGLVAPEEYAHQASIIKGDDKEAVIAAAAIIAKVCRDERMKEYAKQFPEYGFEQHKGYGTKAHMEAIRKHGMCEIHRKSFLTRL